MRRRPLAFLLLGLSALHQSVSEQQKAHPGLIGVDIMLLVISDPLGDSFCRQHHALLLFKALLTLLFLQPTTVMTEPRSGPRVNVLLCHDIIPL